MELDLLGGKVSVALSVSWLLMRILVIVLTPIMLKYECEESFKVFLWIVFYSTLISVVFQGIYFVFKLYAKHKKLKGGLVHNMMFFQVIYLGCDYLAYGLFRFVLFIIGALWVFKTEDCDDEVWVYGLVLVVGYFGVCWVLCWAGCLSVFIAWWNAQTL